MYECMIIDIVLKIAWLASLAWKPLTTSCKSIEREIGASGRNKASQWLALACRPAPKLWIPRLVLKGNTRIGSTHYASGFQMITDGDLIIALSPVRHQHSRPLAGTPLMKTHLCTSQDDHVFSQNKTSCITASKQC